jgi:ribosome maturation factor RimP
VVDVTLRDGGRFTGRILTVGEDDVVIDIDGEERATPYAQIRRAVVQVELNRPSDFDEVAELDETDASGAEVDQEES